MLGGNLVLMVALCQAQSPGPEQDPAALVVQLGSARYAGREAAAQALERIGRPALAALRGAGDSRDPEVRTRAGILAQKIESALLTQPTRLRLDFQNTPLPEVAKSLSLQSGFRIELYPAHMTKWRQQRVNLSESGTTDFWKAIDRVCDLAGLQYNPRMHGNGVPNEPVFSLTDGMSRTLTPVSDHGPFRVSLIGVDYQRHLSYGPSGPGAAVPLQPRPAGHEPAPREAGATPRLHPTTTVQFSAQLLVAAEPRLTLSHLRKLKLVEAVDDHGSSLIPIEDAESMHNRYSGYLGTSTGPVVQVQAPLRRPEAAGQWIKRLRGNIPLTVSSRRPNPLVVPLNGSAGKTFENHEYGLTVHDIRPTPTNHNLLVELSIKAKNPDAAPDRTAPDMFDDGFQRADPQHLQIEVIDANGRLVPWFQSGTDAESSRFTLTVTNQTQTSQLKELRYYTLTRASVEIPFEFADIPMP